jgi:hypothetical protein
MRNFFTLLFATLIFLSAGDLFAYEVTVKGIVVDDKGLPVAKHKVDLSAITTGRTRGYSNTLYTDANGIFEDEFDVDSGVRGTLLISTASCKDKLITKHFPFTERKNAIKAEIRYCTPAPAKCKVQIRRSKLTTGAGLVLEAHAKGTAPFKYLWSTGETTQRIKAGGEKEYCVTVVDATGCEARTCIKLLTDRSPDCKVSIKIERTANGVVLTAIANGAPPFNFSWSTGETSQRIIVTQSGEYCVKVEDNKGCLARTCIDVKTDNGGRDCGVKITQSRSITGTIVLTAHAKGMAPFKYKWSTGENTQRIQVDKDGEYCVVIVDSKGCEAKACIEVKTDRGGPDCAVKITAERDSTVLAGVILKAHARGSSPFKYEWTTGDTTPTIMVVREGEYCVKVEDSAGCIAKACFKYSTDRDTSDKCRVKITIERDSTTLAGAILKAHAGGTAPFTYMWSTGDSTQSIKVVREGEYCVKVEDSTGCVAKACFKYTTGRDTSKDCKVEIELNRTATGLVLIARAKGAKPFKYFWSTGDTTQRILATRAGEYCVKVVDSVGCIARACYKIAPDTSAKDCGVIIKIRRTPNDTNVVILIAEAKGSAPFIYKWSTGETTASIKVRNRGQYCVSITDSKRCQSRYCITLPNGKGRGGIAPEKGVTSITLYPNPTVTSLRVEMNELTDEQMEYRIINSFGRLMATGTVPEYTSTLELDLGHLPTGTYSFILVGQRSLISKSFYKQ